MMKGTSTSSTFRPGRHLEVLDDPLHDPYQVRAKASDPSVCSDCGAVYRKGRWQWGKQPADATETTCPACLRTREHQPAGYVAIEGGFWQAHQEELLRLVKNLEDREKAEHPLQRIMGIDRQGDKLLITTTDTHLALGIGEALKRAYKGETKHSFSKDEHLVRVNWRHDLRH